MRMPLSRMLMPLNQAEPRLSGESLTAFAQRGKETHSTASANHEPAAGERTNEQEGRGGICEGAKKCHSPSSSHPSLPKLGRTRTDGGRGLGWGRCAFAAVAAAVYFTRARSSGSLFNLRGFSSVLLSNGERDVA